MRAFLTACYGVLAYAGRWTKTIGLHPIAGIRFEAYCADSAIF